MIYLNTAMEGLPSEQVIQSIYSSMELEHTLGPSSMKVLEKRFENLANVRKLLSDIVNASTDEIVVTSNTTEGVNIILNGLSLKPGDEILITNHENYSCIVPFMNLARFKGINIKEINIPPYFEDGIFNKQGLLEKISNLITPRLKLAFFSHILFTNGAELPVEEMCSLFKKHGVFTLVDGAQAVGHIPLDIEKVQCDSYAWTCSKWLNGPPGCGGLYVRRDQIERITPHFSGWRSVADFETMNYKPSAARFEVSTLNFSLLSGLQTALEAYLGEGMLNRYQKIKDNTHRVVQLLSTRRSTSMLSIPPYNGILTFFDENRDSNQLNVDLSNEGIVCKFIGLIGGVRLSISHLLCESSFTEMEKIFAKCL
ncbi:L-cysteine/cystine lyase [Fontibacillus panacisegetis]|uniref:L-cysteine/cystine lyase n=1 Tax=Fontibacillus panacisegetis TaxID=670482 RepID=A0A1G7PYF7_9BACL|nr:aminotransferase class V-fold PLP-dependent enzyme [Fontibacillus panacisegetis]SDF91271.1 L-cysteine/cystine lyase [Fontibacillus panacisegetis]